MRSDRERLHDVIEAIRLIRAHDVASREEYEREEEEIDPLRLQVEAILHDFSEA
jgi:hypothetical protein